MSLAPEDPPALARQVTASKRGLEKPIDRLRVVPAEELRPAGLTGYDITGRPKTLWSIYKKKNEGDKAFEAIYDLLAVRVLGNDIPECYHVLGVIHHKWTPLQERIKDYIASPKSNGYQSLHTTVFGPGGQLYEIQIRTHEMHHTAEYGSAAHWLFKEGRKSPDELDRHLAWFRQLLELQQDAHTPEEFLEFLKVDLYQDEIFVFTPRGDVKRLPKGATPIDFAFAVHTEVGQHCQGARINGRIAPPPPCRSAPPSSCRPPSERGTSRSARSCAPCPLISPRTSCRRPSPPRSVGSSSGCGSGAG